MKKHYILRFWLILIATLISGWIIACLTSCVHGLYSDYIIPEGTQEELVDSCDLNDIDSPNFRAVYYIGRFDTVPSYANVTFGIYTEAWVKNYEIVRPLREVIKEIVSNYITFDSMIVIDHSGIVNGELVMDFWFAFRSPGGSWNQYKPLQFELPGYVSSYGFAVSNYQSMLLGTLPNYSASDVVNVITALPSWQRFRMKYTNLNQEDKALIYDALLADCKCCARIDTSSLNVPQEYIDKFLNAQMTLGQ